MGEPNEKDLERAAGAAVRRFHAMMEGRDTAADPVAALVDGVEARKPELGLTLHAYRLVRELGSGGMGVVFLAERADGQFQKQVALKVMRGLASEDGRQRLRRERQILAELDHPGIARLLDGGETPEGQPYLVMEFIEGHTLFAAVAQQPPDLAARVTLLRRIAEAVAHAHQRLVVHRDLKPTNVMVTPDGTPRLLDFGVARLLDDAADERSTRVYSVGYASPEQLAGGRITTRTDVYALGVLLLELLSGVHADGTPTEPPLSPVAIDVDLRGIALKASAARPEDRYPTADALLEDLERWRRGLPVRARPDTLVYRTTRFVRRHLGAVLLALAVLAGATAFVVRLQLETRRAQRAEAAALEAKDLAERESRRAQHLLSFLSQTFDAAAPDNAQGRALSAAELVTDAERHLDETPTGDRPAVELMLADLSSRLGESERAMKLSEAAVRALGEPTDRAAALWAADAWERRAAILDAAGEPEQAVDAARTAVALVERFAPGDGAAKDAATLQLGLALVSNGDAAGRPLLERFLTGSEVASPAASAAAQEASRALCDLALQERDGVRALEEAHRSRRLLEALPAKHPQRHYGPYLEARALQLLNRPDEAVPLLREAIAAWEGAFGSHGSHAARLQGDLGALLNDLGLFREAAEATERSRALLLEVGDSGASLASADANAASILEAAGDYARAEALTRSVLATGGALPPSMRQLLESNLARVVALEGRFDEARADYRRLLKLAAGDEPNGTLVGLNTLRLVQLEVMAGRPKEARAALEAGAGALAQLPPSVQWHVARASATVLALEARLTEAVAALLALEQAAGVQPFDLALVRVDLAEVWARQDGGAATARQRLDLALPVLRRAVLPTERNRVRAERLDRALPR